MSRKPSDHRTAAAGGTRSGAGGAGGAGDDQAGDSGVGSAVGKPEESGETGETGGEYVRALDRGLAVLRAFSFEYPSLTLTEVARRTDLTRATARRFLHTLERLGYVRSEGRDFALTPKVLELGFAYLSSLDLATLARADMEALVARTHESSSAAVLDGAEVVYVARVPTRQIMTVSLAVGSRLPAFATAMGRVLLAAEPTGRLGCLLAASDLRPLTPRTCTDPDALRAELGRVAGQGWALVDQELELGLRSVAAPLRDASNRVVAALNLSTHVGRVTPEDLRDRLLPMVCQTAAAISTRLAQRG